VGKLIGKIKKDVLGRSGLIEASDGTIYRVRIKRGRYQGRFYGKASYAWYAETLECGNPDAKWEKLGRCEKNQSLSGLIN